MNRYPLNWDLTVFLESKKNSISDFLSCLQKQLSSLEKDLETSTSLITLFESFEKILEEVAESESYILCLLSENTQKTEPLLLQQEIRLLQARADILSSKLDSRLALLSLSELHQLESEAKKRNWTLMIKERLQLVKDKLPLEKENLITSLAVSGYHGYFEVYSTLHNNLIFDVDGESLSFGQLDNLMSHPNRTLRVKAFEAYKKTFTQFAPHFAQILNHLGGFRLEVYKQRGWSSFLKEPLFLNRMQSSTLDSLFAAIDAHSKPFTSYLKKKAELLGLKGLSWHDVDAPLFSHESTTDYKTGSEKIIHHFKKWSPELGDFSKQALEEGWVESENRPHKGPGGFCTGFPLKKQSRIFMTYLGTESNLSTLAHELGHAYHNRILFTHPYLAQNVKMNLAETASTMAEILLSQGLLQDASTKEDKLLILNERISRSIIFFMNLKSRFVFESSFYEIRQKEFVPYEVLNSLMIEAQKHSFHHSLEEYNPHFWASKMHFYFSDVPFYNFPYIFGYLFSLSAFAFLKQDPSSFEKRYNALLLDSSLMTSEELAKKHFGVDLGETTFWDLGLKEATDDVALFMDLMK